MMQDERIEALIDFTKRKLGLEDYYLYTHQLRRTVNLFNETIYTLGMEWFPSHIEGREEDGSNPKGTACIDIDVHTRQFQSVIFVGGKTYANGITFKNVDTDNIVKWVEEKTGLVYKKQFKLLKKEKGKFQFQECIDGIAVSPSGSIDIECDEEGNLTFYAVHGQFPTKELVKEEDFSLTLEKVGYLAKEQWKMIEFPSYEENRIIPMYAFEEIYVKNDGTETIPFEPIVDVRSYTKINQPMHWDAPLDQPFEEKEIELSEEITSEQAFSNEPSPDSCPITKREQEKCVQAVQDFLRTVYSQDTGKWILKTLHRDNGYIHATLRLGKTDNRSFQRKLLVFIDAKSLQALNFMDNKPLIDMFNELQAPGEITITKEEAFEKIRGKIELKPYYVYDFEQQQYVLCGKLDCEYGVNSENGEVIALSDL